MRRANLAIAVAGLCTTMLGDSIVGKMHQKNPQKKIAIIDTRLMTPYSYASIINILRTVGITVHHIFPKSAPLELVGYDGIILSLDQHTILNAEKEPLPSIIKGLHNITADGNKLVIILVPGNAKPSKDLLKMFENLLYKIGAIDEGKAFPQIVRENLKAVLKENHKRNLTFATTLKKGGSPKIIQSAADRTQGGIIMEVSSGSESINEQYGVMLKGPNENHYAIIRESFQLFADLNESFYTNPIHLDLRKKMLRELARNTYGILKHGGLITSQVPCADYKPIDHYKKHSPGKQYLKKIFNGRCHKTFLAWLDLFTDGLEKPEALKELARLVLKARSNAVWIEINPETFLGPGRGDVASYKDKMLSRTASFLNELRTQALQVGLKPPSILLGLNLTSNFGKKKPKKCAIDLYGKKLDKIPDPLDLDNFWKQEVLDVIEAVTREIDKRTGRTGSIDGIFLDLELYHAPDQAASFENYLGGAPELINDFLKGLNNKKLPKYDGSRTPIEFLYKTGLLRPYINYLQARAKIIGEEVKAKVQQVIPGGIVGVYLMYIEDCWFHRGFLSGLSSKSHPVLLATFNNDLYSHFGWLARNNIYTYHLPVVMLSKVAKNSGKSIIEEMVSYNDGVWFNKFNRLVLPADRSSWQKVWTIEANPPNTSPNQVAQIIAEAKEDACGSTADALP